MKIEDVALIARIEPGEEIPESKLPTMLANIVIRNSKGRDFLDLPLIGRSHNNDLYYVSEFGGTRYCAMIENDNLISLSIYDIASMSHTTVML